MGSSIARPKGKLLAWLLALLCLNAQAATFPNLYTVTVSPDPAARDQRSEAVRLGMASLLARVTGRTDAGGHPDLRFLIENADNYVNSYGLVDRQTAQIGFIASAVQAALEAADWPVWGAERPMTLIWMAVDAGNGEQALLGADGSADGASREMTALMQTLRTDLRAAADARGLPITLPLLDLADRDALTYADVAGGFSERIARASARYGVDSHVVASARMSPFGPEIRWTLEQDNRRRIVLTSAIRDGLDWLAEQYAAQFSIVGGARGLRISVLNVDSLGDYGRVMSYLESLSLLESVDIESFDGTELHLRVAARGDDAVLRRVLALGGVLRAPAVMPFRAVPTNAMVFEVVEPGFVP